VRCAQVAPLLLVIGGLALAGAGITIGGLVVAIVGIAVIATNELIGAPSRVIARVGGRILGPEEQPGLRNVVEGLCVANGLTVPELRILDDDAPNALVLARGKRGTVLFCTRALLVQLTRIQLEGVVAHELAHVKNGDARRAAHAMGACGAVALLSRSAPRFVLALGDPRRESLADLGASEMTRYPPGLRAALAVIARAGHGQVRTMDEIAYRLTAPLWCAPLDEESVTRVRSGVLDLELRVEALAEL
jgi:Zn-dependent protease with chaperone function